MRKAFGVVLAGICVACSDASKSTETFSAIPSGNGGQSAVPSAAGGAGATGGSSAAGGASAGGTSTTGLGNSGVLLSPPNFSPGSCLFIPDGDLNGYIRTGPDGKAYLKVNDHSGTVIVALLGGPTWSGTGRATIDWPNYRGDPASNVNMQVDGDVSLNGQTASASCHYLVAGGKKIQESLTIH